VHATVEHEGLASHAYHHTAAAHILASTCNKFTHNEFPAHALLVLLLLLVTLLVTVLC
jgi:hypothetical protein